MPHTMLVIRDAQGHVIGAQLEDPHDAEVVTYISPADPLHSLHRLSDVPEEIVGLTDPAAFHVAITEHITSGAATVTPTSVEELHATFSHRLAERRGESAPSTIRP